MTDLVPLLKFTPSAQDPEILEAITVQRESLVTTLVESTLDTRSGLRHHLLVGPRGSGKTHILSLIARRLRIADPDTVFVVLGWLDEDPWAIRTYDKFLAAIVARVARETNDPELADNAAALRPGLNQSDSIGEELLRHTLGSRRLVLLVENLDEIFRRIGDHGQAKLRAFAEDWGQMLIIATSPQLFAGIRRHASPFYGFFAVTHLEDLKLESATELLIRVARLRGDTDVERFLSTETAERRLMAIEALAGGNPRVWLLLAGCISIAAIDELVPLFLEALDDLTPYYQDRLRELGDQQQELIILLSEAGGALSNRELAERAGLAQNQVATIVRQLADRGYIRRAQLPSQLSVGDRRMSFWELREPLMRLCLEVKQSRSEPLRLVVEFLRAWYGSRLLDQIARIPPSAKLARLYAQEAFRALEEPLQAEDLLRGPPSEIIARADRGLSLQAHSSTLQLARASGLLMEERFTEARELLEQLVRSAPKEPRNLALELELAIACKGAGEPLDSDAFIAEALEWQRSQLETAKAWTLLGITYQTFGRATEASEAFDHAARLEPENALVQNMLGTGLFALERFEDALAAYSQASQLEPDNARYHHNQGIALQRLERYHDALAAYSQASQLEPDNARYHSAQGVMLSRLAQYDDALAAYTQASQLEPDNASFHSAQGVMLSRLAQYDDALAAYTQASQLEPDNGRHHNSRADLLRELGRLDESELAARQAISYDDQVSMFKFTLTETVLTRGEPTIGISLLRQALATWSDDPTGPPGDTELLVRIIWERFRGDARRRSLIAQVVEAYQVAECVEELGRGVVASIPLMVDETTSQQDSSSWLEDWLSASSATGTEIPLSLLGAADAWKRDQDRSHILALPPEQRRILIELLSSDDAP
jgi:tetratricopeptide (TPR) repeat protein